MKWDYHFPRGPRSCSSYVVSSRHHLIDPIRPTRGHIAISPHSGLYAMSSLCGSAEATHEWFRAFAAHCFLSCRPLRPRGVRTSYRPNSRCRHGLRHGNTGSTLPISPQSVSRGRSFRGCTGSQLLQPDRLLASPDGSDRNTLPATGGFYVQAFDGAVTLTVAGYDYDIEWTPMSAGLPPAAMAASFAARSHKTWRADFPHHALRQLVHSFYCYHLTVIAQLLSR